MKDVVVVVVAALWCGCVSSGIVVCEDGTSCPADTICDSWTDTAGNPHGLCATKEQIAQCDGKPDRAACVVPEGPGTCHEGVCLAAACGNGRLDLVELEACDDGGTMDRDGCAADCTSDETCGNGFTDLLLLEDCDDSGFLSHDGCSSVCQAEPLSWTAIADPVGRFQMKAAYDAARGKVVMFGGFTQNTGALTELNTDLLSEWDGVWRGEIIAPPAPARDSFMLAYDLDIRRVVLFGGHGLIGAQGDTWLWDGVSWDRGPDGPLRYQAGLAYDAKRKRIVMFGGYTPADTPTDETWEFDGIAWAQVFPATKPGPRSRPHMTYDAKRGVIAMFGGGSATDPPGAMWEYDGTNWTMKTPTGSTPPYANTQMFAYEPGGGRIMLYGGFTTSTTVPNNQLWLWNGTQWSLFGGTTPPGRGEGVLVPDGHGRMMIFGGRNGGLGAGPSSVLSDTWFFDGVTWTRGQTPPPKTALAVASAPDQGKVVRFGGEDAINGVGLTNDTWELTSMGWQLFAGATPPATELASMVYDAGHRQFVLFGGISNGGATYDNKTWLRTGTTWSSVQPTPSPGGRLLPAMFYDAARGRTIMYGGYDANGPTTGETWSWDGTAWTNLMPAHTPTNRVGMATGYDPIRNVGVLFAGANMDNDPIGETWIWDGSDWVDAMPVGFTPPIVLGATLTWNPARQALVLAGSSILFPSSSFETWEWKGSSTSPPTGTWERIATATRPSPRGGAATFASLDGAGLQVQHGANGQTLRTDTLELVNQSPRPDDSCEQQIDLDGDGLIGCDDPDCWPVCSPLCPPGTTCPATAPTCGDGTCSALESCHSCPGDCTTCTPVCGDFVCDPGETGCPGDC